jgi:hypothetical protein
MRLRWKKETNFLLVECNRKLRRAVVGKCFGAVNKWVPLYVFVTAIKPRAKCTFHVAAILSTCNWHEICIFFRDVFWTLYEEALVSLPPHKFVRSSCWYYWLKEIKYSCGATSLPHFMKIRLVVLELTRAEDRLAALHSFILCILCKELFYGNRGWAELCTAWNIALTLPITVWDTDLHTMQGWEAPAGHNITN